MRKLWTAFLALSLASFVSAKNTTLFSSLPATAGDEPVASATMDWGSYLTVSPLELNLEVSSMGTFSAGKMTIQVDGIFYNAHLDHFEEQEQTKSWFGRFGASPYLSHFAFVGAAVAGKVWLPDGTSREIISRGGKAFLVEMNDEELAKGLANCQMPGYSPLVEANEILGGGVLRNIRRRILTSGCPKGQILTWEKLLLYIYDATTLDWFLGDKDALVAFAQACVDGINAVHTNSLIPQYRVRLVGVEPVNYTSEGDLVADAMWMQASGEVATLRARTGAVEVGLLVGISNSIAGIAWGGISDGLYGMRPVSHIVFLGGGIQTAIHEDGHNDGMQHQKEDCSGWTPRPDSFGWFRDGFGKDVTAVGIGKYCPNACPSFPVVSNPNVRVSRPELGLTGIPAGIPDEAENWRMPEMAYQLYGILPTCQCSE